MSYAIQKSLTKCYVMFQKTYLLTTQWTSFKFFIKSTVNLKVIFAFLLINTFLDLNINTINSQFWVPEIIKEFNKHRWAEVPCDLACNLSGCDRFLCKITCNLCSLSNFIISYVFGGRANFNGTLCFIGLKSWSYID